MTSKRPNLSIDGPTIDVQFLMTEELEEKIKQEKEPEQQILHAKALIDTGASHSVIQEEIPKKLGLQPVGTIKINTPSSKNHECYQYFMRMMIPSHGLLYEGVFTAAPLEGQNITCLIGRDMLANGILIYIGYDESFTLSLL